MAKRNENRKIERKIALMEARSYLWALSNASGYELISSLVFFLFGLIALMNPATGILGFTGVLCGLVMFAYGLKNTQLENKQRLLVARLEGL